MSKRPTARQILGDRNMRILFAGASTNMFGTTAMIVVLGIWVKDLTGSSGAAGLIFLLMGATPFLAPITGLLVDRFPRRTVLIINDSLTAVLIAVLLVVHNKDGVWLIYLVAVGYGLSGQIYRAARGGLMHSMVPGDLLGDANGLLSSLNQGMRIVGPLAGAGIYAAWGGPVVAWVDIGTFVVSVASYLLLRQVPDLLRQAKDPEAGRRPRAFLRELIAGARHVLAEPVIRRIVIASGIAFAGAGMIDVAVFSLVDQGLHRSTSVLGVITSIEGVGSLVAGLCVGPLMRRFGEYSVASIGYLLNGVGLALSSLATLTNVIVGSVLLGIGLPMVLVAELTIVQRHSPGELQGRALSASDAIITTPFTISIGIAAVIIGTVGYRAIYFGVAMGFIAVGLGLLRYAKITKPEPAPAEPAVAESPATSSP